MKNSMIAITAAMFAAGSLPALAGGPVIMAPEPAPIVAPAPMMMMPANGEWTGFYAGATLGYGNASTLVGGSDMLYGVRAGYDLDLGMWVLGATASYDMTDMQYLGNSVNSLGRLGMRAGYDAGKVLPYITGGAAWVMQTDAGGNDVTENGWFAGVGAEYQLTNTWTLGAEISTNRFSDSLGSGNELDVMTAGVNANFRF